ncbi:hypothetical protein [Halosegnis marinus]|uniref:Fusaric acid resistance protein-like n=1 Tax=Halosegnis marinus TaxID=3034023 RepID=A0ABD5ZMS5_9EURY|nr:hypothetical protein [Halosegnis sp. DT85]
MTRLAAPRVQRGATRLLQAAIAAMLAVGVATANLAVVVNAALSLAATFLPAAVARDLRTNPPAWLTLFVAFALFLHTLGMLGLYGDVWWYDHLTHTLSATLVAGVGYVAVRALADHDDRVVLPPEFTVVLVLLATLALGVVWELLEFAARGAAALVGAEPVLVQYGLDDTLADLLFDAVGATVAAALGPGSVGGLVDAVRARLDERGGDGDRGPGLDALVRRDPANARRSWLVLAGLVAAGAASLSTGALLPAVAAGGVLALALVPAVAVRDRRAMLPWRLLALAALPAAATALARPWLASAPVAYLAVAAVALVVAVELHAFTPVEMTPGLAVAFVVATTLSAAAVWALVRWALDLWLDTGLLLAPGVPEAAVETALMWEFVAAAVAGVAAGVAFERWLRRTA